jgi:hypothetical protein
METPFILRRALQAMLPAVLLLASCGKDDDPAVPPVADAGKINAYHQAASANVGVKVLFDDAEKATLTYGQSSNYQSVNTGSRTIKINVASSGTTAATQTVTVEKDKNYSYFAYANTASTVAGLFLTDDLTAPTSGNAKIRLVHLAQGSVSTPLKISSTSVAGLVDVSGVNVLFAGAAPTAGASVGASEFVSIPAGSYNLSVTTGTPSISVAAVGDGTGAGTGTKNYESGKVYTIIYRGINNPLLDPTLQPKAIVVQNN